MRGQPRRPSLQERIAARHAGSQEDGLLPGAQAGCQCLLLAGHFAPFRAAQGREAARQHVAGAQRGQGELEAVGARNSLAALPEE